VLDVSSTGVCLIICDRTVEQCVCKTVEIVRGSESQGVPDPHPAISVEEFGMGFPTTGTHTLLTVRVCVCVCRWASVSDVYIDKKWTSVQT